MQASYNMLKGVLIQFDCSEIDECIIFLRTTAGGFKQHPDTAKRGEEFEEIADFIQKQHNICSHS